MKDNPNMKRCITVTTALCIGALLLSVNINAHDLMKDIRNKAFTDPSLTTAMPDDWVKKPVVYEKEAEGSDLSIVLDQDIYHTFLPIIQRFGKEQNLKIAVKEGTCGIAAGMINRKTADIAGFCCPPSKEDRLPGIKFHTIGIVSKAIIVHQDNPVESVSIDQARDIFRGKITKWSELKTDKGQPGPNRTIHAIGRFHCKARPGHWYLLLPDDKLFSPLLHEVGSIPDMISNVGVDKDAVGWEVMSMADHYKETGKVKALKINGYSSADKKALISKKYPLYRVYNLTTWEGNEVDNVHAKRLIDYMMKEVENIDSRFGFVPSSYLVKSGWKFKGDELIGDLETGLAENKK